MTILAEIYRSSDGGCNVGYLVDKMQGRIEAPAVTLYLKQIEQLGLVRRECCGRYVNYYDDMMEASDEVGEIALMIRRRVKSVGSYHNSRVFRALMNAFRARVCHYLLKGGNGDKHAICAAFQHGPKYLVRDLRPAVDAGLLKEDADMYCLVDPDDLIIRRIIECAI